MLEKGSDFWHLLNKTYFIPKLSNEKRLKLAVDGMAASGKGDLLDRIDGYLKMRKLSTGDRFRTIALYLYKKGLAVCSDDEISSMISKMVFSNSNGDYGEVSCLNNALIFQKKDLRIPEIEQIVGRISSSEKIIPTVDKSLLADFLVSSDNVSIDGRDRYVLFADIATAMIYLFANENTLVERAIMREKFLTNGEVSQRRVCEIRMEVNSRNERDMKRKNGRLQNPREAKDSGKYDLIIDSSRLGRERVASLTLAAMLGKRTGDLFSKFVVNKLAIL